MEKLFAPTIQNDWKRTGISGCWGSRPLKPSLHLTPSSQLYDHHIKALSLLRFTSMNQREGINLGPPSSCFDHGPRRRVESGNFYSRHTFLFWRRRRSSNQREQRMQPMEHPKLYLLQLMIKRFGFLSTF